MTVIELMDKLNRLWPFANEAQMTAWANEYRLVLKEFQGATLAAAWAKVLSDWGKTARPMPADFRRHCERPSVAGSTDQRPNMKEHFERSKETQKRLIAEWWAVHQDRLAGTLGRVREKDRPTARYAVEKELERQTWIAAQQLSWNPETEIFLLPLDEALAIIGNVARYCAKQDSRKVKGGPQPLGAIFTKTMADIKAEHSKQREPSDEQHANREAAAGDHEQGSEGSD